MRRVVPRSLARSTPAHPDGAALCYAPAVPTEISPADVAKAQDLLAAIVSEAEPNGNFAPGTALRDLVIKGLSIVAAQVSAEAATARALQSIRGISTLANNPNRAIADDLSVADAADAWLSNWFATRGSGDFARGEVTVAVARRIDYTVPRTARFQYDQRYAFYPDYAADLVIAAADLRAVYDARGQVAYYVFPLRLVAAATGSGYNVDAGQWAGTGGFSNYVLRVTSSDRFYGGQTQQSTADYLRTASTSISVRNLVNAKSIAAVLPQRFPQIRRMLVVGMGDPEMGRDTAPAFAGLGGVGDEATGIGQLHLGGCVDIYCELPLFTTQFTATIGGAYARTDRVVASFGTTASVDFIAEGIVPGDVLQLDPDAMDGRTDFLIVEVFSDELRVTPSPARAFTKRATGLLYRIYRPLHGADRNVYPLAGSATDGFTSDFTRTANRFGVPAGAFYDVIDIAVTNPDPSDPFIDPADGYVHFRERVEVTPVAPLTGTFDTPLPYRVLARDATLSQTSKAFVEIEMPAAYNGKRVVVRYDSNSGFDAVDAFVLDTFERTVTGSPLVRAMHPVYLSFVLEYTLRAGFESPDTNRIAQALVRYINTFDPREVIDVSDITTFVRNTVPAIDTVYPFTIDYQLLAPDGTTVDYATTDRVVMHETKLVDTGIVRTAAELLRMGVSDRTTRFVTNVDRIDFVERPA